MLLLLFIMLMICAQSLLGNSLIHTSFIGNKSIKCCFCCQGANTPQMRAGSTWRPLLWTYTAISFYPTPLTRPGAAPALGLITCTSAATRLLPPLLLLSRTGRKSGYVSVIQEADTRTEPSTSTTSGFKIIDQANRNIKSACIYYV